MPFTEVAPPALPPTSAGTTVNFNFGTADKYVRREPLRYGGNGRESLYSIVIATTARNNTAGAPSQLYFPAGSLLVYDATAKGYIQASATALAIAPLSVILSEDVDLRSGSDGTNLLPFSTGGYYAFAEFNFDQLTLFGKVIADLKTAFPTCFFHVGPQA
jgi:hypothetical protein